MSDLDSNGYPPQWKTGEKVWVSLRRLEVTVIQQTLSYIEDETFWGDVIIKYDNGITDVIKNWQITKINR